MRLLLVEDEPLVIEYLKRSLAGDGHEVDTVTDGDAAYQKACSKNYDVIILDIIIPRMSGLEVCKQLREVGNQTPIIMLTSLSSEHERVQGLDAGADDYLLKPFSYAELSARLRALYRRPKTVLKEVEEHGNIAMNLTEHTVWKGGEKIYLRSKEFSLLEYLLRNKDRVVTREELLKSVWGVSPENASNRADVCIRSLREKLGKNVIKTVPKIGYRLSELVGQSGTASAH